MLRPGVTVGDRYVVIEQIAEGGMGTLWRAHHVELDVDVALKAISLSTASPEALTRFKREAQAAARLRSPNIVQVLDYGVHEDEPYLAMELLRGQDLAERIALGRIPPRDVLPIVDAIARAIQLAHDAKLVHRDLKPGNVFLERVGDVEIVKVLDFGIAKDMRSTAVSGMTGARLIGSPAYMSPEQVWGEGVDGRSDVWSMGVLTFEMLTGVSPFDDETLAKIFERILRAPLPKVREIDPSLPASLDVFFERAFSRAAADRTPTAKAFFEGLREAIEDDRGPSVSAPLVTAAVSGAPRTIPSSPPMVSAPTVSDPDVRPAHTRRRLLLAVGALVAVLVAVLALRPRPSAPLATIKAAAPDTGSATEPPPLAIPPASPSVSSSAPPRAASSRRPAPPRRPPPAGPAAPSFDPAFGLPLQP